MKHGLMFRLRRFRIEFVLTSIFYFSSLLYCQSERKDQNEYSITDQKYNSIVLADVGPLKISAEEFLLNYEFGPAFPKREPNSKERYLNFMIYEKLLALDGYAARLQQRNDVQLSLAEVEGDLATEELYKDEVVHDLKVSPKEISAGVKKESIDLTIQWIYTPSEAAIREQHHLLQHGVSFDSLFKAQIDSSVHTDDRSMQISEFKLEERNPMLSVIIDTLKPGSVSTPFRMEGGWYIVRYGAEPKSLITTQSEIVKMTDDVKRVLVKRKSDSLSDRYVNEILFSHKPVIIRTALNNLMMYLAKQILRPETFSSWRLEQLPGNKDVVVDSIKNGSLAERQLVQFRTGSFTVKDFLTWYKMREMNLKLDLQGPQKFFVSLEPLVWRMVRDKLLIARAFQKGFQKIAVVQRQKKWWEDKLVYQAEKMKLQDSIPFNDSLLYKYYTSNLNSYKDKNGEIIDFKNAKADVQRDYYSYEVMKRTVHRVLQLKQKYTVTIHNNELKKLYVETENQPRAIDVYAAKTGGTFPRPAFPSIDYEWQKWN